MKNLSEQVLKQIKEDNIKPKPRWHFVLKNYFIWLLFGISIILGCLAFSMILFMVIQLDWDVYQYVGDSFLKTLFISLPYLWLLFLILFIATAYYNFIHTKRGYRFRFITIVLMSLFISVMFGTYLYFNGFSENIENIFFKKIPYYNILVYTCEEQWMQPEKGLLAGTIVGIEFSEHSIELIDFNNSHWQVDTSKSIIKGNLQLSNGLKIKMIGNMIDKAYFQAIEIRPWKGQRKMLIKNK